MRSSTAMCVAVACAAFLSPRVSRGAGPCEVAKLLPDPGPLPCFGASVANSGDYVVVGDPCDGQMGSNAGAAYVFHRVGPHWERQAKIFGSDTGFQDTFGFSAAIDGDRLVVGAPHNDFTGSDNIGWAYVFERAGDTRVQQQKLISSGSAIDDYFGWSVSIRGGVIVVGAPGLDYTTGWAYVFRWNGTTWVEEAALIGLDTAPGDFFSGTLSLDQDRLLVGAQAEGGAGAAYVFRYNGTTWTQEAKLTASDGAQGDSFGSRVSLSANYAAIGAPNHDYAGPNSGAMYIFAKSQNAWVQQTKLTPLEAEALDHFGAGEALVGNFLLVGAPGDNDAGDHAGAVYLFEREEGSWTRRNKFFPRDSAAGLAFGRPIGFDGVQTVIAATSTAYVYAVPTGAPCIPTVNALGALVLAGLIIIGGIRIFRRRRLCGKS